VAEGKFNYPVPSAPILPSYEHQERRRITRVLPANNLGRWRVTWSYTFETRLPIVGLPSTRATNF